MKITRELETYTTVIEITDLDLIDTGEGDAIDILLKLAEAISLHGNLPVYDGYRNKVESVGKIEREFYESDEEGDPPTRFCLC